MTTLQIILVVILIVSAVIGYFLINRVQSLLHTPLMSGMNALSGITLLGALIACAYAIDSSNILSIIVASMAVIVATINVVGGFLVTNRMLRMFKGGHHDE